MCPLWLNRCGSILLLSTYSTPRLSFDLLERLRIMARQYTLDDLDIRTTERQTQDGQILAPTHTVIFRRALTAQEQQQFARLLCSLYDVVYFSGRFGASWL